MGHHYVMVVGVQTVDKIEVINMTTKYKKYVICETCEGLGKVEKEFFEDDVKKEGDDKDAKN